VTCPTEQWNGTQSILLLEENRQALNPFKFLISFQLTVRITKQLTDMLTCQTPMKAEPLYRCSSLLSIEDRTSHWEFRKLQDNMELSGISHTSHHNMEAQVILDIPIMII
jgi:hypothetical protein